MNPKLHNGCCNRHPTLTDVGAVVQAHESFMPTFFPQYVMKSSILVDSNMSILTLSVATANVDLQLGQKTTRDKNVTDYTIDNDGPPKQGEGSRDTLFQTSTIVWKKMCLCSKQLKW